MLLNLSRQVNGLIAHRAWLNLQDGESIAAKVKNHDFLLWNKIANASHRHASHHHTLCHHAILHYHAIRYHHAIHHHHAIRYRHTIHGYTSHRHNRQDLANR
jgi:hypothetical protein